MGLKLGLLKGLLPALLLRLLTLLIEGKALLVGLLRPSRHGKGMFILLMGALLLGLLEGGFGEFEVTV